MAGRGFQKIGNLADAKELRKLNDQLYSYISQKPLFYN